MQAAAAAHGVSGVNVIIAHQWERPRVFAGVDLNAFTRPA